jgi:hypothetical protein
VRFDTAQTACFGCEVLFDLRVTESQHALELFD